MKVLIVKTSSMGDIIHTLPALTDAVHSIKNIRFDWLAEEAFAEIPQWHQSVDHVIPVALRRWKKNWVKTLFGEEWKAFKNHLKTKKYDCVIDAQGLIKSALLTRYISAPVHGFDRHSAKEPIASFFYSFKHRVFRHLHAVERTRQLFAKSLGYCVPETRGEFNLLHDRFPSDMLPEMTRKLMIKPYILFLHGTTRADKHWPVEYWCELATLAEKRGISIFLPWGNPKEKKRAEFIRDHGKAISVLPRMNLEQMAAMISNASGVVAVDSGLGHLTAALDIPAVSLYGPTDPHLIGTYGKNQLHLTPKSDDKACNREVEPAVFSTLTPDYVWSQLMTILTLKNIEPAV